MLEAPPLSSLLYIYVCGSLRFSISMSVVCDKGKGRPLGELKATFSTAMKCYAVQQHNQQSQCVLLALCICALGRSLTEKVLGLCQRRPPPPPTAPQTVEHPSGSHIGWRPPPVGCAGRWSGGGPGLRCMGDVRPVRWVEQRPTACPRSNGNPLFVLPPFSFTNRGSLFLCVCKFVENLLCFCEAACRSSAPRLRVRRLRPQTKELRALGRTRRRRTPARCRLRSCARCCSASKRRSDIYKHGWRAWPSRREIRCRT